MSEEFYPEHEIHTDPVENQQTEQLVDGHAQCVGKERQKEYVGHGGTIFPFGNRLRGYTDDPGKALLRHGTLPPQLGDPFPKGLVVHTLPPAVCFCDRTYSITDRRRKEQRVSGESYRAFGERLNRAGRISR